MAEEDGQEFLIVEKDPAAIGQEPRAPIASACQKKANADWIRHSGVASLVYEQLLGAVDHIGAGKVQLRCECYLIKQTNAYGLPFW